MRRETQMGDARACKGNHSASGMILGCVLIPPLLLTQGCGETPVPGGFTVDTLPSGRVEILNTQDGVWGPGDAWEVEEMFRLGSEDADSPELFSLIPDLELDPFGRLWLIERQDQEIRIFDQAGAHVRTIGREGEGPGEFKNVAALLWAPGGELWAVDQRGGRISVFDTTGTFQNSKRLESFFQMMPWPGGIDSEGNFYDLRSNPDREAPDFIVRFDSLLRPIDTVFVPWHPNGPQRYEHRDGNSATTISIPFSGRADWHLCPDGGLWVVITDRYEMIRLAWAGDTVRVSKKEYDPIRVTSEEIDEALEGYSWFEGEIDRSRIPETKPAIQRSALDDEGNLWVIPLMEGDQEDRTAEVFDSAGIFLGSVQLPMPLNTSQITIRSNRIVAVTRDSLFVPSVVGLRIRKPGEGQ